MNFWRDKTTLKLTAALFALFLFLFFLITYISHQKFAPGQGLATSVSHEALVQFVTHGESKEALGIDAQPATPALRAPYETVVTQTVVLKNLTATVKEATFQIAVEPTDLATSVRFSDTWPMKISLQPNEEKILSVKFLIEQANFKTHDGILNFKILF